ncbi:BTAD domain-containing putative transcriptional regulator [Spirillospora sp. CA-294931]|uniref:BTAD domain-containing putative transcriptional regulator n=1 Tax=Spirillospora sp. CA-294931 TaxID=3240042 RepID=UPI003D8FCCD2
MRFGLLGTVEAWRGDERVVLGGPLVRGLLAMLCLDAGRVVGVERLIDGLYGEDAPSANALQSQVSRLRRALGDGSLVEGTAAGYRLVAGREEVDVLRFEGLAGQGRAALGVSDFAAAASALREGLGLWRGAPLADISAPFVEGQARRLEELRASAVEDLAEAEFSLGEFAGALPLVRELVAEQPLRERAVGLLMRGLYGSGRQAEALRVFEDARGLLAEELGADPSAELAEVHLAILRGDASLGVREVVPSNLPAQLTSFVGREEELRQVGKLLTEARLVTLLGPGGAGKTRLAVEAGQREEGQVCFVDLAPVGDGAEIPQVLLNALGLREHGLKETSRQLSAIARLLAALAGRELLLILDNCEHLVDKAARITQRLLSGCPGLRVLATSREALGITGEVLRPLPPLSVPPEGVGTAEVLGFPAVRLFADRAVSVRPGFAVDAENVADVLRICGALDGLPLAIELAAARLRSLTVEEVARRLDDRFRLLSRGDRTAAPRHQTLRAVVEWSWDLLDEAERLLVRRLTVFSGGATQDAAERVCGLPAFEVDDLLAGLIDKSLVHADDGRYRMLETVRAFGAERLLEAGEEEELRHRHAAYFLDLVEEADGHLRKADQLAWMARLAAEHANIQSALRWTVRGEPLTGVRLMSAVSWYGWLRGVRSELGGPAADLLRVIGPVPPEGLDEEFVSCVVNAIVAGTLRDAEAEPFRAAAASVMDAMQGPPRRPSALVLWAMINPIPTVDDVAERRRRFILGTDPWLRALDQFSYAYQCLFAGDLDEAAPVFEEAVAGFRALGDRWGTANTLDGQAQLAEMAGDQRRSLELLEAALDLAGQLGAKEDEADLLARRAEVRARLGDLDGARSDYELAAKYATWSGAPLKVRATRLGLADVARLGGDTAAAIALYDEVLSHPEANWGWDGEATERAQIGLGWIALEQGDLPGARARFRTSLESAKEQPLFLAASEALEGLAAVALAEGEAELAATLLGVGGQPRNACSKVAAEARDVLGEDAFTVACERGSSMNREDALAFALG